MDKIKTFFSKTPESCKEHPLLATLAAIGALAVGCKALKVVKGFWRYVIRPGKNLFKTYGNEGACAIVTGGSSGIGLAYAKILAKAGFNLILIARDSDKLEAARNEILKECAKNPPVIRLIPFDFSCPYTADNYARLKQMISEKNVAVLVNNVGADYACEFQEFNLTQLAAMVNININPLTYLTRMVIPGMLQRKQRSAIINISSTFTQTYVPYFSLYIATKTYMEALMNCLHKELKDKRIDVLTTLTGEVTTPRNLIKSVWHSSAPAAVKAQLSALGYDKTTAGTWRHVFYGMYLRSGLSCHFKKSLGETVRKATLEEFEKDK